MANRRSVNWPNQVRVNTSDIRSIESAVRNDFDELISSFIAQPGSSHVVRGFKIPFTSAIGSAATGLQLEVANASLFHGGSDFSGTFLVLPENEQNQTLNSTTNTKVDGAFTPNTLNYIGIEFDRKIDDSTASQRYFWNPTTNVEFTQFVPLAEVLDYKIVITSSVWDSNVMPVALVQTDASNNVVRVDDRRDMLFRLGKGGTNTPDPFYVYPWNNDTEGREENFWSSSTNSQSPFNGGDKQIQTQKEWMDAVMSQLLEIKGTTYWYQPNIGGSLVNARYDLGNTTMTGSGSIIHDGANPGRLNWTSDINLTVIGSRLKYTLAENSSGGNLTLQDDQVAYVELGRGLEIIPQLIFIQGSPTVESVGGVSWTGDLQVGDYIKVASEDISKYYQIDTIVSTSEVTLTENYLETSTGPQGIDAQYAIGTYEAVASPSTERHIKIADRKDVPFSEDVYWFFLRTDNGGVKAQVFVRSKGSEVEEGESIEISDNTSEDVLDFIGSTGESDSAPNYSSNIRGSTGESLTSRAGVLTDVSGDYQEDRSAYLRSEEDVRWTGDQLEFSSDIVLDIVNTKDGTTTTHAVQATSSPIALADGESAWILIDRSVSENISVNLSGTTAIPAQTQANKDVIVLFKRVDNSVNSRKELYSPFLKQLIEEGQTLRLGSSGGGAGVIKVDYLDPISTSLPTGASVTIDGQAGQNGDRVLFSNLSTGNNRVYELSGVGSSISWEPLTAFDGSEDPTDGDAVIVSQGDAFREQFSIFDGLNWKVNDTVRYFDGVSADFWEQSSLKTSDILASTTGDIFTVSLSGSENIIVDYSIVRGSAKETGTFIITSDGTDVDTSQHVASISDPDVELFADISGSDLRFRYTASGAGDGVIKYFVRRWSNSPGGPSGIPSYSGTSGSSILAAGAIKDIQYHGSGGSLSGDSDFQWDDSTDELKLGDLKVAAIKGSQTINDNQTTPSTLINLDSSQVRFAVIEYSIERGGESRIGRLMVCHNTVVSSMTEDFTDTGGAGIDNTAISLTSSLSGGSLLIQYTSNSTGNTGSFKYSIRKWQ